MLEFLKTILGENYTEETDKKISEEIGKAFVSKSDFNVKNEAVKTLETQLETANKTIEDFKGMDIEGIKEAANLYKKQALEAKETADKAIQSLKFDYALNDALRAEKCKDVISVKAHLNLDGLKQDGGVILGLKEQLETIKKDKDFLFNTESAPPPSFGSPLDGGKPANITREDFKKMTYTEKLKVKTEQPELYNDIIKTKEE